MPRGVLVTSGVEAVAAAVVPESAVQRQQGPQLRLWQLEQQQLLPQVLRQLQG